MSVKDDNDVTEQMHSLARSKGKQATQLQAEGAAHSACGPSFN